MRRGVRQLAPVLAVFALLGVILVASSMSDPGVSEVPMPTLSPVPPGGVEDEPDPEATLPTPGAQSESGNGAGGGDDVLGIVVGVLVAIGAALALWYVVRRTSLLRGRSLRARSHERAAEDAEDVEEVADAVQAGIDELGDDATDPRRAVIACWLRLESAAATVGTTREPGDTPADLVTRMLAGHQVSARSLHRFATLYRRARYAPDEVADEMRTEARTILTQVRAELTARAATVDSAGATGTAGDVRTTRDAGTAGEAGGHDRPEGRA